MMKHDFKRTNPGSLILIALFVLFWNVFSCIPASGETFMVKDGQPQAEIVIGTETPRMVKLAAEELQTYVEKISGAKLAITNAPTETVPVKIYVGKSPETDRLGITDEGLKYGAFRMVSGKNYLVLLGHDSDFKPKGPFLKGNGDLPRLLEEWDKLTGEKWGFPRGNLYKQYSDSMKIWDEDERGSLNAVYEFLRMQGVRWYMPTEIGEIVPKKTSIEIPEINKTVRPDFALRFMYQYGKEFAHEGATRDEILWRLRLGENRGAEIVGNMESGLSHGSIHVHSRDEVKKAHPEYYYLVNGKRDTEYNEEGHPCLSSEGLFQQNVKYVRAMADIFDAPMVSVMPQDGYVNICQCSLCKGKDTPERGWNGQVSDYVWDYVNRVAIEVYKTHPKVKIQCFAYGAYLLPPTKIGKLSPNVIVGICQHRYLFLDPKEEKKFADLRKAWLDKMTCDPKKLIIWDYYLHTAPKNFPSIPFYFPHAIAKDLRSLKGISMGEFIEVYRDKKGMNTLAADHLNMYVTSRFWWNADQDVDALLAEYYSNFYGPAAAEMKSFMEYCEANLTGMGKSADKIDKVFEMLDKAQKKVPADTVYGKRIAMISDFIKPMKALREQLAKGRGNVPETIAFDRNKSDIKIDGKLDDKFWEGLRVNKLDELETGRNPISPTTFKVGWADDALYFGIRCEDKDSKNLSIATTKNKDGSIWNGDCVEILLETQTHSYYQLAINPAGALMDLDRKTGINTLWASGAEVAAYVGDGYWSLEIRIPVAGEQQEGIDDKNGISGNKPNEQYPWYFNVCRQRIHGDDKESSAFSPTGTNSFHEVIKFGKLFVR